MSDASINPNLLLATLDLSLVQMLTQAIRTADLSSASKIGSGESAAAVASVGPATPAAQSSDHRWSSKPAATFEKSHEKHWYPRCHEDRPYNSAQPVQPVDPTPFVQPPWKTLAWPTKHQPVFPPGHRVIKIQQNNTDVGNVGRTLDLFV